MSVHNEDEANDKYKAEQEDLINNDEYGRIKMTDLHQTLEKLKAYKQSRLELTIASSFTRRVRRSPLPRSYRMTGYLKFDESLDPMEYLNHFNTEMEVYLVKERTRCRLLAVTMIGNAYKWFQMLLPNSISSWEHMSELFVAQFSASIAYTPPVNTLANIKQRDDETLREYFIGFNEEVPKVRKASDETLKKFLIAGVRIGTNFWKDLQGREPETLSEFYSRDESHKVI